MLVNLVIGLVINSLDRVLDHEGAKQLCNQARIIDEVEALLPAWFEQRHRADWHPAYVHVLRINPDKLDAIELDALWTRQRDAAPVMRRRGGRGGGGGGGDGGGDGEEGMGEGQKALQDELKEVKQMLVHQQGLLEGLRARAAADGGGGSATA